MDYEGNFVDEFHGAPLLEDTAGELLSKYCAKGEGEEEGKGEEGRRAREIAKGPRAQRAQRKERVGSGSGAGLLVGEREGGEEGDGEIYAAII